MEINGLANMRMILDGAKADNNIHPTLYASLTNQAILMEKYLVGLQHIPDLQWHEVRENQEMFFTLREMQNQDGPPFMEFLSIRHKVSK